MARESVSAQVDRLERSLRAMPREWVMTAMVEQVCAMADSRFSCESWDHKSLILGLLRERLGRIPLRG